MNIKDLLYNELLDTLIDSDRDWEPGDTLKITIGIKVPLSKEIFNQLSKDIYKRAVESDLLRGCFLNSIIDVTKLHINEDSKTSKPIFQTDKPNQEK